MPLLAPVEQALAEHIKDAEAHARLTITQALAAAQDHGQFDLASLEHALDAGHVAKSWPRVFKLDDVRFDPASVHLAAEHHRALGIELVHAAEQVAAHPAARSGSLVDGLLVLAERHLEINADYEHRVDSVVPEEHALAHRQAAIVRRTHFTTVSAMIQNWRRYAEHLPYRAAEHTDHDARDQALESRLRPLEAWQGHRTALQAIDSAAARRSVVAAQQLHDHATAALTYLRAEREKLPIQRSRRYRIRSGLSKAASKLGLGGSK